MALFGPVLMQFLSLKRVIKDYYFNLRCIKHYSYCRYFMLFIQLFFMPYVCRALFSLSGNVLRPESSIVKVHCITVACVN